MSFRVHNNQREVLLLSFLFHGGGNRGTELKQLAIDHTASEWQSQSVTPGGFSSATFPNTIGTAVWVISAL